MAYGIKRESGVSLLIVKVKEYKLTLEGYAMALAPRGLREGGGG